VDDDRSPLAGTEVHYLSSERLDEAGGGRERKIFVGHCGTRPRRPGASAPSDVDLLVLTDANGAFGLAVDVVRHMQLARHLPPMLVVGVGYRAADLADTVVARTLDLTPTSDARFAAAFPAQAGMGGAAALHAFVREELLAWIAARWSVAVGRACYFGHSFGALWGTWVLLHHPDTFARYALASPSLWWDDRRIFIDEADYAAGHDDLDARVWVGIGADETDEGREREAVRQPRPVSKVWPLGMVDDVRRLGDRLAARRYPGLDVTTEILPGEFHVTVPAVALSRGLRHLFDAPR
jgi:predicted alpha/beta superfamily hydrolase